MNKAAPNAPLVSVIMPMRNAGATLDCAITSVVAQTMREWELIVIDDASTDASAVIAEVWEERDRRVRVLFGNGNGPGAARNLGIEGARGTFLHFLDADDRLRPEALETLSEAARSASEGAVFGAYERVGPDLEVWNWECRGVHPQVGLNELLDANHIPILAQMISRESLADVRFDPSLPAVEDWDLWLRLAMRGVRWQHIDTVVAEYRQGMMTRSARYREVSRAIEMTLTRAFDEARCLPEWIEIDTSEDRLQSALGAHAIEVATCAALRDLTFALEIAALGFQRESGLTPDPRSAASCAYWMLPTAAGRSPEAWRDPDRFAQYADAITSFWASMRSAGLVDHGFAEQAIDELAVLLVPSDAIIDEICLRCEGAAVVTLLGNGANGSRLAATLLERGMPFQMIERAADMPALMHQRGRVVVTPTDDRAYMLELGPELELIRWSVIRRRLADGWRQSLRDAAGLGRRASRGAA